MEYRIKSIEDFRRIKAEGKGYIVITDKNTRNRVHHPFCFSIKEEYYTTKVITNHCRAGDYIWIDSFEMAKSKYRAVEDSCVDDWTEDRVKDYFELELERIPISISFHQDSSDKCANKDA
jgi:hypothetical protein